MSNIPNHGKETSADTYTALTRHQFNLESLGQRLQRIENTTAAMKDKWRRGDEAMRDFTVNKPQTISRRINDPGIVAACHCEDEYETEYSESIDTHPVPSIDTSHPKSTDADKEKSVNTYPDEWENDYYNPTIDAYTKQNMHTDEYDVDYEEERAIEYRAILDEEDKLLHHSSWKRTAPSIDMTSLPSIDMTSLPSIDTQPQQRCRDRASTDTAYYKSVDTDFNHVRKGDYSIGSWADEPHHESFAVETVTYTTRAAQHAKAR
ncbi:hypothetical protein DY000_02005962 [Brassica cretica]|uniref:Uncharacterized protein n=1 Tax=Brassica cretica TaxID=69181 RepID=A0ABQ7C1D8_BRACR|nr:hypothetical protein DY000_02005962 [Brassica cretica]